MIVGFLYTSTGLAFHGALDQMLWIPAMNQQFSKCKILKHRQMLLQIAIVPVLVLLHFVFPKILNGFELEDDVKRGSILFSFFMVPAALLFMFTVVQAKYLTLMGYPFIPLVASMLGFGAHWGVLTIYSGKANVNTETIALATTFGFVAKTVILCILGWTCTEIEAKIEEDVRFCSSDTFQDLCK